MSSKILGPPNEDVAPTGHPKLLQLETPLRHRAKLSAESQRQGRGHWQCVSSEVKSNYTLMSFRF